ncbi:hypothetical protein ABZP36_017462 [Zizania latifolia]
MGLVSLIVLLFVTSLYLRMLFSATSKFVGLEMYITTAVHVMAEYAVLLLINARYIGIFIIPAMLIGFVAALCSKLWEKSSPHFQHDTSNRVCLPKGSSSEQLPKLAFLATLPLLLQLLSSSCTIMLNPDKGQQQDTLLLSHFLLFFTSALGTLAVMVGTLPAGVSPGAAQVVVPVLQKTCVVLLLITAHTMAAEWLGEDVIVSWMPGLVAVLAWFTTHFVQGSHAIAVSFDTFSSHGSEAVVAIVSSSTIGLLAYLATAYDGYEWEHVDSRCNYALSMCGSSLVLSYLNFLMLQQWPESTLQSEFLKLLEHCMRFCFSATALLSLVSLGGWVCGKPSAAFTAGIVSVSLGIVIVVTKYLYRNVGRRSTVWPLQEDKYLYGKSEEPRNVGRRSIVKPLQEDQDPSLRCISQEALPSSQGVSRPDFKVFGGYIDRRFGLQN